MKELHVKHDKKNGGTSRQIKEQLGPLWDRAKEYWTQAEEWTRFHLRHWTCIFHDAANESRNLAAVPFLAVAAVLGVTITLGTLYSTSYAVTVDGEKVGVVPDQSMVDEAIETVEKQGRELLGYDYQVDGEVDYHFTLALKSDLADEKQIENFFYEQLSEVSDRLRKYQVSVNGRAIGVVDDQKALEAMLVDFKNQFVTENTVKAEFVDEPKVDYVYNAQKVLTIDEMHEALRANSTGETTYVVNKGDTFNGIAYANDMSVSDLQALNPGVNINRLMIGDVLNVKEVVPSLSVRTLDHEVYSQPIACPVETRENSSMYKGETKIVSEGVEGEARVTADVTYVNGIEKERNIVSSETVREPTPTIKAVGTKERPKTASTGQFSWPVRGRITSYFGNRHIFGTNRFHSGLDIAAPTGTPIKAADGGKVTFAGNKSTYGKLVIITHDNGVQTYYAHNSSLVVSAGQRVYKGQTIAKCGSTGRSTGSHCHFEVRINGTAVNPLSYLR